MSSPGARSSAARRRGRAGTPTLSKSKYLAGLQCELRVWLQVHQKGLATPPDDATQARFDAGTEVGERARGLFPGGVLVDDPAWRHAQAVRRTRGLLDDPAVPAIFEAAFEHAGVRIRADVLERLPGGAWGLREVKSSSSVKDVNLDDLAVQHFVLEGAGLRVTNCELIHINTAYVRGEDGIDWERFFARADRTAVLAEHLRGLPERVSDFHTLLKQREPPVIEPGYHCKNPYDCEFWDHCTRGKPKDWILHLPRLGRERFEELRSAGHERITELPDDVRLTDGQVRIRDTLRSGELYVSPGLVTALEGSGPPACYLDFETANPAMPLYPGTRPYQTLPFQWSLHRVDDDHRVSHQAFLAEGADDPRRAFCEGLLEALPSDATPVHVYSHFEATRLSELINEFPDLAPGLNNIRERLLDLLPLVRQHVYHPDFGCSYSIKAVAPALVPDFRWDDLGAISEGSAAAAAWPSLVRGTLGAEEAASLCEALLAYCERDTLALVEVHRALCELALTP